MIEDLKKQLSMLVESKGQTMANYEKLINYYQTSLGWSEEKAIEYIISLFNEGVIDEIIMLGKDEN